MESYSNNYPIAMVAQQAVLMVERIMPYCGKELQKYIMAQYELLQIMTPDYHHITLMILPYVKLYTKLELSQGLKYITLLKDPG